MKKVLYAMIYAPDKGGSGAPIYCYNLMTQLPKGAYNPGVIFSIHKSYRIPNKSFWNSHPIYMERPPIFDNQPSVTNSIALKNMSEIDIKNYIKKFYDNFKKVIKKYKYDLIHVQHGMYIGYAASRIKHELNIPYIITLHIMELNFLHEFPDPILALKAMTDADKIIALTEAQKQRLINEYVPKRIIELEMKTKSITKEMAQLRYDQIIGDQKIIPENIVVCPLGIDTKLFRLIEKPKIPDDIKSLNLLPDQKIVYFAGRLINMKGIKNLIDAEKIYNNNHDTHTIVIGGGELSEYVLKKANKNKFIHYLGFKPQYEMPFYHNTIAKYNSVFCVPSSSEGLSLVYLEAMCSGLPVIACCIKDMGDLDFMQKPYASFVNFGDINALALKIREIINTTRLSRKEFRAKVIKYNLRNMYKQVNKIYKSF